MEQLLHYVWKHKLFPLKELTTSDGQAVEVIDPGLHNRNAGPDFFNAKVRIGQTLWVGNVEIHDKASDWYLHGHDKDRRYDNVILHVAGVLDAEVMNTNGEFIRQMQLDVPDSVRSHYEELLKTDSYPPCYKVIPDLTRLMVHALDGCPPDRTPGAEDRGHPQEGRGLRRKLGGRLLRDPRPQLRLRHQQRRLRAVGTRHTPRGCGPSSRRPLPDRGHLHGAGRTARAGGVPAYYQQAALNEGYFAKLRNEYLYLAHKFSMKPMDFHLWRFLRLRPQNFPHIRISQLANLYYQQKAGLSQLVGCETVEELKKLLTSHVTPYWETHYTFGSTSSKTEKHLGYGSLNLLMINTAIPMLFAYGRHRSKEVLCDRAFDLLEQLKAENNYIIRMWQQVGLPVQTAGDSQALIQLKKEYCDKKDCLRCRFGYEYLRRK